MRARKRKTIRSPKLEFPDDAEFIPTGEELRDLLDQVMDRHPAMLMMGDRPLVCIYNQVMVYGGDYGAFHIH